MALGCTARVLVRRRRCSCCLTREEGVFRSNLPSRYRKRAVLVVWSLLPQQKGGCTHECGCRAAPVVVFQTLMRIDIRCCCCCCW